MSPTIRSPTIETIVSITLQVLSVSLTLKLKYSLNSQNPESFTCENMRLPAPVAKYNQAWIDMGSDNHWSDHTRSSETRYCSRSQANADKCRNNPRRKNGMKM